MKARILLASTFVLTILLLTHPALAWATDSFTIEANPTSRTVAQGDSTSYTITVGSSSGLPVSFGVTVLPLPSGVFAAFNPPSLQPPVGGTASSALNVTADATASIGSFQLNVTASDSSGTHWVIVTLVVLPGGIEDFVMSVSPNSLVINRDESKTVIATVQTIGGFGEGFTPITLSVTGLPANVTGTFTPNPVEPPNGRTANSTMRISVEAGAIDGTYPLTIVSRLGTLTRSASFTLIILPTPSGAVNVGVGFAFIGIGLGVAVAGIGVAFALSGQRGSEFIVYGGWYYCRKHRVPLWYVNGGLWCPIERRHVRMG